MSSSHKKSDCQCDCVEELAEQLEKRRGDFVVVYERNGDIARGTIKDVKCDSVLILKNADKMSCCFGAGYISFTELVISICEITEFGVMQGDTPCSSPAAPDDDIFKSLSGNK
ncbi:hypothetical protein [Fictibacillus sp. KU28468]|uniref:hypothetical protein n=1 Tax=Fictibacillus sp. KU28468 TaxID=2991053 RepID=UPI00223D25FB|nr:hypothetical protein [Fictibacillus sp. KU28468]UZJ78587.1 hypothetical protein OKX00_21110 [Fictibacillus sp. KU28468]